MRNKKTIERYLASLILMIGLMVPASANYLILAPTATTLTTGQVRAEAAFCSDSNNGRYYWLGTGLQQYELSAIRFQRPHLSSENMLGIQMGFMPETSLSPAVAFGVRDLGSQSKDGAGVYAVVTKHLPVGLSAFLIKDFAATVGVGAFGIRGPFCGFEAKLPMNLLVQGEYDSRNLNASIGWQPTNLFRVKAYTIQKDFFVGAEIVPISF